MSDRFFIDTNVFVYSFDHSAGQKAAKASELIRSAIRTGKGFVSYQVVQEFFNVAFRRFQQPLSWAEGEQYLSTVFRPLLVVHSSLALYSEAARLMAKHRLAWFDSLIVVAALHGEADVLVSEDLQDGQTFGALRVENPFK